MATYVYPAISAFIPFDWLNYFAPHAGHTWCGRFFSPHVLQTPHGITDNASCERRCALRALLVLLFGVAILHPFYFLTVLFYSFSVHLQGKLYIIWDNPR